jgi:Na+/proline symporter
MQRSVLDAGLAVLSYASGPVLGAFLLGTLASTITERETFAGMLAGLVAMTVIWGWTPIAFTWYIFIGASITAIVAFTAHAFVPPQVARR